MRRSASELIRSLEMRIARLENRTASTKKMKNPILVRIEDDRPVSGAEMQVFCPKSELRNIEGFGKMHNGQAFTEKGSLGLGSVNPMCATQIVFISQKDLDACLSDLSRTYTLIEAV